MKRRSAIARGKEDYFVFGRADKTPVIPGQPQRVGALRRPMTGSGLSPESITPVHVFSTRRPLHQAIATGVMDSGPSAARRGGRTLCKS
jgi:hypothetical protein